MYIIFFFFYVFLLPFFLRPKVDVILVFPVGFVTQEKVSFFYCIKGSSEEVGQRLNLKKKTLKKFSFFGLEIIFVFQKIRQSLFWTELVVDCFSFNCLVFTAAWTGRARPIVLPDIRHPVWLCSPFSISSADSGTRF